MKYKVSVVLEFDNEYFNGNQIEDIKDEITMLIADYNCFLRTSDVTVEELTDKWKINCCGNVINLHN